MSPRVVVWGGEVTTPHLFPIRLRLRRHLTPQHADAAGLEVLAADVQFYSPGRPGHAHKDASPWIDEPCRNCYFAR